LYQDKSPWCISWYSRWIELCGHVRVWRHSHNACPGKTWFVSVEFDVAQHETVGKTRLKLVFTSVLRLATSILYLPSIHQYCIWFLWISFKSNIEWNCFVNFFRYGLLMVLTFLLNCYLKYNWNLQQPSLKYLFIIYSELF
jgi:hypothetical protein